MCENDLRTQHLDMDFGISVSGNFFLQDFCKPLHDKVECRGGFWRWISWVLGPVKRNAPLQVVKIYGQMVANEHQLSSQI